MAQKKKKKKIATVKKKKVLKAKVRKKAKKKTRKIKKVARRVVTKKSKKPVSLSIAHVPPEMLPWRNALPGETCVGIVDDYFGHVGVLASTLKCPLHCGDKIHVRGHTTDLIFTADSIQIEHQPVTQANAGDSIGVKVQQKVRKGDYLYKIVM